MKSHISSPVINKNSQENIQYAVLIFACIALCFTGIVHRDLWTPDEPRVAAISLEMSRNGNFIIPYLAGEPFIEKPPLHFALAAGLTRIFGTTIGNTGAIRLLSALMALGTLAVTFLLARRLGGMTLALPSAVILATMPGFIDNFHRIRVDPSLAFFVAAAIWCFAEVYVADRRWYCLPAGLFTAGAFLVKGFIGPVVIGMGWLGLAIPWGIKRIRGQGKPQFYAGVHGVGVLLFVILTGSWMALFRLKGGADLWNIWLWGNQVGRLLGTSQEFSHLQPGKWYYYLIALAMYGIPWISVIFLWVWFFFQGPIQTTLCLCYSGVSSGLGFWNPNVANLVGHQTSGLPDTGSARICDYGSRCFQKASPQMVPGVFYLLDRFICVNSCCVDRLSFGIRSPGYEDTAPSPIIHGGIFLEEPNRRNRFGDMPVSGLPAGQDVPFCPCCCSNSHGMDFHFSGTGQSR